MILSIQLETGIMIRSKANNFVKFLNTYAVGTLNKTSKQCPAVRTHCLSIKTPLQNCSAYIVGPVNFTKAMNGRECGSTVLPLAINGIDRQKPSMFCHSKHS